MTTEAILLVIAALATGYGAAATLGSKAATPWKLVVLVLYLVAGIHLALVLSLSGGALIVPGHQINPAIVTQWEATLVGAALAQPWLTLVALLAHILLVVPDPTRRGFLRPLPASIGFLFVLAIGQRAQLRGPARFLPSAGPERVAYLTLVPRGDGVQKIVFAQGEIQSALLKVMHEHEARGTPPRPRLFWTRDGAGVVFVALRRRLFALGLDGEVIGALPEQAEEWPQDNPGVESVAARRRFSKARMEVDAYIEEHGGLFVP